MGYIKELYIKNPKLVNKMVKKLFYTMQTFVEVSHDEEEFGEDDIMFRAINKLTGEEVKIVLEDFAICYGLHYLEMSSHTLQNYLEAMARIYGNEYLQGFHDYRKVECKELVSVFNARTYAMEDKLAKAINDYSSKKQTNNKFGR